jgi:predicted nuclease of predicted toxin-antitoxin system
VKLKLDDNLSRRAADLIRTAGHDAATVFSQGLRGAADETLFEVRGRESRALVTSHIESPVKIRFQCAGIPFHDVAVSETVANSRQSTDVSKRLRGFEISYHPTISRATTPFSATSEV